MRRMDDLDRRVLGRGPRWLVVTLAVLALALGTLGVIASWLSFALEDAPLTTPLITTAGVLVLFVLVLFVLRRR